MIHYKKDSFVFSLDMVKAILSFDKRVFRTPQHLDILNLNPDIWQFVKVTIEEGACFQSTAINEKIWIDLPYKLGEIMPVESFETNENLPIFLKTDRVGIGRIRNVDEYEAIEEGVKVYQSSIAEMIADDPGSVPEEEIFRGLWTAIHGPTSFAKNYWVWVYGFEVIK